MAILQLGRCRLDLAVRTPHGVYVAMNGRCFPWDDVVKNRELGIFEPRR